MTDRPARTGPRQVLPTGRLRLRVSPGPDGRAALAIYRPLTVRGRLLRTAVAALPGRRSPADPWVERLAGLLRLPVEGACVMASSTPGRSIVGLAGGGRLLAVAKLGRPDDLALRHEADVLARLPAMPGVRVPRLLLAADADDMVVCATAPVAGSARADGLAALHVTVALARAGWTHGDLAPWNLIGHPPTLLDWERAQPGLVPFADLAHFVVQSEARLGRGNARAVVRRLCAPGGLGAAYLAALGLPPEQAADRLREYLEQAGATLSDPVDAGFHRLIRELL